jgi:hypothetical protein
LEIGIGLWCDRRLFLLSRKPYTVLINSHSHIVTQETDKCMCACSRCWPTSLHLTNTQIKHAAIEK